MPTVYLVRHGESHGNKTRLIEPPEVDVLTDFGKVQAELAGQQLSEVKFSKAYASTYSRTIDTAKILLSKSKFPAPDVNPDPRIREKSFGIYDGGPYKDALAAWSGPFKEGKSFFDIEIPQAETWAEIFGRIESFLVDLCKEAEACSDDENILVVSHAFLIHAMFKFLCNTSAFSVNNLDESACKIMRNTAYFQFTVTKSNDEDVEGNINFVKLNVTDHLSQFADTDPLVLFAKSPMGSQFSQCIHV